MVDDAKVLAAVQRLCAGPYPPSVRDVQLEVGLSSPSSAYRALVRLRDQGLIEWETNRFRTIRIKN